MEGIADAGEIALSPELAALIDRACSGPQKEGAVLLAPRSAARPRARRRCPLRPVAWATDGLRVFFWDNPLRNRGLGNPPAAPLRPHDRLLPVCHPPAALSGRPGPLSARWRPLMHVPSGASYATFGAPYYLALTAYLLAAGGVRGAIGWLQSSLSLSATYVLAVIHALLLRPHSTHLTPKILPPRFTPLLLPQLLIILVLLTSIIVAIRHPERGSAAAAGWAAYCALALSSVVTGLARSWRRSAVCAPERARPLSPRSVRPRSCKSRIR
jgi:hypothetical protein